MTEKTLPSGIITFLFSDIEGSTPLWEQDPGGMHTSLEQHNHILHKAISTNGGTVFKIVGDEFQAAFVDPAAAVSAALAAQHGLATASWGSTGPLRVRMGLHLGYVQAEGDDYISSHTLNRVARIMAAGHGGQILLSNEVEDLVRAGLSQPVSLLDLGQHHMKGMQEPEHIYQLVAPDLPRMFPHIRSLTISSSNLPAQPTPFVGRETELLALKNLLGQDNIRLLTVVGPGGMGKTRLALAAAEEQMETGRFSDGITFIPLAPLSDVDQIVPAMAQALDFPMESRETGESRAKQQLLDYLQEKKMLLLLDNFEHLLDGAALVVDIVQSAPDVKILTTSRERLQLRIEQVYPIEGLEFPDWETPADAESYTAVQLFLQSARRNQPDFALRDGDDLTYLARVCRLVAGMPLALELAASWVDMLPLAKVAAELQQGLDLLESDTRDMPERHRSIRTTIDYSWQKLEEKERDIFAKLSIFRGGFTRNAARAVAGANLRQLARLVNKSFLQYNQAIDRYQVHELMRQFGAEKLKEEDGETAVRDQHCSFYCSALQQWEAELKSDRQRTAMAEIEGDYRNIMVAWEYALERGHLEQLLIAVNGLGEYYDAKGHFVEGMNLFQEGIQRLQPIKDAFPIIPEAAQLRIWWPAWALHLDINARGNNIDPEDSYRQLLRPSLELLELDILSDRDTRLEEAYLRLQLGRMLKRMDGKWEEGKDHLTTCLRLYRELGDLLGVCDALYESHFYTSDIGLHEESQKLLQKSSLLLQQLGEPRRLVRVLLGSGIVARKLQAFTMATELFEQAHSTARAAGYLIGMVDARHIAVQQAWHLGQFDLALSYSRDTLTLAQQANSPSRESLGLTLIGMTQVYRGEFLEALEQFQQSITYRDKKHLPPIVGWLEVGQPLAELHAGYYETILSSAENDSRHWSLQWWVYLAKQEYAAALSLAQRHFTRLLFYQHESLAELHAAMALAQYGLKQIGMARWELYQSLQTSLKIHSFVALMQLMPIVSLLLADTADPKLKKRAVELWAMAESLPFVGNSQLYADLVGKPMDAVIATLPTSIVAQAQGRGRELDWWETAELLVTELDALGWILA